MAWWENFCDRSKLNYHMVAPHDRSINCSQTGNMFDDMLPRGGRYGKLTPSTHLVAQYLLDWLERYIRLKDWVKARDRNHYARRVITTGHRRAVHGHNYNSIAQGLLEVSIVLHVHRDEMLQASTKTKDGEVPTKAQCRILQHHYTFSIGKTL